LAAGWRRRGRARPWAAAGTRPGWAGTRRGGGAAVAGAGGRGPGCQPGKEPVWRATWAASRGLERRGECPWSACVSWVRQRGEADREPGVAMGCVTGAGGDGCWRRLEAAGVVIWRGAAAGGRLGGLREGRGRLGRAQVWADGPPRPGRLSLAAAAPGVRATDLRLALRPLRAAGRRRALADGARAGVRGGPGAAAEKVWGRAVVRWARRPPWGPGRLLWACQAAWTREGADGMGMVRCHGARFRPGWLARRVHSSPGRCGAQLAVDYGTSGGQQRARCFFMAAV
jgi:hypothetical protein